MKEFLEMLSRGKSKLMISFTEEVRKRNLFTGQGFGTGNPSKSTTNGATEHLKIMAKTNAKHKNTQLSQNNTLSTVQKSTNYDRKTLDN